MNRHRSHNRIAWAAIVLAWAAIVLAWVAYFSGVAAMAMRVQ